MKSSNTFQTKTEKSALAKKRDGEVDKGEAPRRRTFRPSRIKMKDHQTRQKNQVFTKGKPRHRKTQEMAKIAVPPYRLARENQFCIF